MPTNIERKEILEIGEIYPYINLIFFEKKKINLDFVEAKIEEEEMVKKAKIEAEESKN